MTNPIERKGKWWFIEPVPHGSDFWEINYVDTETGESRNGVSIRADYPNAEHHIRALWAQVEGD